MKRGEKMSNEQKEKLRQANLGKKLSSETRQKMSETRRGRHPEGFRRYVEEKQRLFGDSRDSTTTRYRAWREAVYARDQNTCQRRGTPNLTGNNRNAHHIISWESSVELRFETSNGQTLCRSCHSIVENAHREK